jgi:hypothetical protein
MPNDEYFRIRVLERAIAEGKQGRADLESVLAQGVVTKPASYREARQICYDAAVEAAEVIDSARPRKHAVTAEPL